MIDRLRAHSSAERERDDFRLESHQEVAAKSCVKISTDCS